MIYPYYTLKLIWSNFLNYNEVDVIIRKEKHYSISLYLPLIKRKSTKTNMINMNLNITDEIREVIAFYLKSGINPDIEIDLTLDNASEYQTEMLIDKDKIKVLNEQAIIYYMIKNSRQRNVSHETKMLMDRIDRDLKTICKDLSDKDFSTNYLRRNSLAYRYYERVNNNAIHKIKLF